MSLLLAAIDGQFGTRPTINKIKFFELKTPNSSFPTAKIQDTTHHPERLTIWKPKVKN
jgi:hypothetical protein